MKNNNNNNNNKRSNNNDYVVSFISCFRSNSNRSIIIAVIIITAIITINITMIFNFHKCDFGEINNNNNSDDGSLSFSKSVADTFFSSSSSDQNQKIISKTTTTATTKTKTTDRLPPPPPPPPPPPDNNSNDADQNKQKIISTTATKTKTKTTDSLPRPPRRRPPNDFNYDTIPSIVWQPWNQPGKDEHHNPFPCYPPDKADLPYIQSTKPAHEGILFQRPTKVGSTTMTNVILRLVHNRGLIEYKKEQAKQKQLLTATNNNTTITTMKEKIISYNQNTKINIWSNYKNINGPRCNYRANHGFAITYEYPQRSLDKSFLFSLLRYPISRAISEYFHFHVSIYQNEPTDINFQNYLQRKQSNNPMIRELTFNTTLYHQLNLYYKQYRDDHDIETKKKNNNDAKTTRIEMDYNQIVTDILKSYNFIGKFIFF
jgi:hypothetical protein